jgi:hypothetical protein
MPTILLVQVRSWASFNGTKVPQAISAICPQCGKKGNFFWALIWTRGNAAQCLGLDRVLRRKRSESTVGY